MPRLRWYRRARVEMHNQMQLINRARTFLKRIGFSTVELPSTVPDPDGCFVKGCWIDRGVLYYCTKNVLVGSLLHEAGHLAITPKCMWGQITPGCLTNQPIFNAFGHSGEFAVEAWGHAAAMAAGIPSEEATRGSTPYCIATKEGGFANDEAQDQYNSPNYYGNCSRAELGVALSLLKKDHIGIYLLTIAGFTKDFPKMDVWFWDNCKPKTVSKEFVDLISSSGDGTNQDVSNLWNRYTLTN